jgi:hypothetical protein
MIFYNIYVPFYCEPVIYPVRLVFMEIGDFCLELYTLGFYFMFLAPKVKEIKSGVKREDHE